MNLKEHIYMKKMNGIYLIIGGALFIALGTFLTIRGQELRNESQNKGLNDNIRELKGELEKKNVKIENLEKWENKISTRLMETLYQTMCSFYATIQEYSSAKIHTVDKESFRILCKGCDLNKETKIRKSINNASHYTLREYLLYNWQRINIELDEINSASTYISPEAYDLFLNIREKGYPIYILSNYSNTNTDLEAWHVTFLEMYNLTIKLNDLKQKTENSQK